MGKRAAAPEVTPVWDLGVRVFHWLMVGAVATALVTGLSGPRNLLNIHIAAGAAIGGLVAFRILWGLTGSTYARFSSFPVHLAAINADLAGFVAGRRPRYRGHNPLGSLMALALLAIISLSLMTGVITLGGVDKQGPLAFAVTYVSGKAAQRPPSGSRLWSPCVDRGPSPGRRLRVCTGSDQSAARHDHR